MKRRTIGWIGCGVLLAGVGLWRLGVTRQQVEDQRKLRFAQQLVLTGRAEEAISVINNRHRWPESSPYRKPWLEVSADVFEQMGNALQLGALYYECPEVFADREEASLLAARALIIRNDMDNFERLRSQWRGKEEFPHAWMVLEADSLLRRGRRAQALALLTENQLDEQWESARHVRLALLHSSEPAEAWRHLANALQDTPSLNKTSSQTSLNSSDAIVRLFRAQLLEATGRVDEARLEYVAARLAQPDNASFCDQLAEFYRRRGSFQLMLDTWQDANKEARTDFIDLKTEFWSRVALPLSSTRLPTTNGPLEGLVRLIQALPSPQFWDERLVPDYDCALPAQRRPEIRWLRRLELLRTGNESQALELLKDTPTVQWEAPLRRSLLMTLNLREFGELDPRGELRSDLPVSEQSHPLITELNSLHARHASPSPELRRLLNSSHGPALVLLAHGWLRGAVLLDDGQPMPHDAPGWAAYGMTQAIRAADNPQNAIAYAKRQSPTAELDLLIAEMMLESARDAQGTQDALKRLRVLAQQEDAVGAVGERANWLAIVTLVEQKQLTQAEQWLHSHPSFGETRKGRELKARIALLQHDVDTAVDIYRDIQEVSIEAKVFFAREACHQGNWKEARRLTIDLLETFPANQDLLRSLQEIEQHLARSASLSREAG